VKYLVTGATGFLGSHLARILESEGHEVIAFSRSAGGDVLDIGALRSAARGCDGAFHCAGKVSRKPGDAEMLYRVHVEGTRNVLEACARAGVKRLVIASSSGTIAVREQPGPEATEADAPPVGLIARWPYYRAKLFAERAALERNGNGIEVVSVNPSLLLGPGDVNGSSTEDVRLVLEGAVPATPAGGISFVDARDAAVAMSLAMERGRAGEKYLVGACNVSVKDFVARIARIAGVQPPWLTLPRSRAVGLVLAAAVEKAGARLGGAVQVDSASIEMGQCFWYLDARKAVEELGWSPRDPNVTLYDTVEDLRARGAVWPASAG
jgi:dihydroflavonol-4-reductase